MSEWTWSKANDEVTAYLGRTYGPENILAVRCDKHGGGWLVAFAREYKGVNGVVVSEHRAAFVRQIAQEPGVLCEWDSICTARASARSVVSSDYGNRLSRRARRAPQSKEKLQ